MVWVSVSTHAHTHTCRSAQRQTPPNNLLNHPPAPWPPAAPPPWPTCPAAGPPARLNAVCKLIRMGPSCPFLVTIRTHRRTPQNLPQVPIEANHALGGGPWLPTAATAPTSFQQSQLLHDQLGRLSCPAQVARENAVEEGNGSWRRRRRLRAVPAAADPAAARDGQGFCRQLTQ